MASIWWQWGDDVGKLRRHIVGSTPQASMTGNAMTDIIAIGIGLLIGPAIAVPLYLFSKREQRQRRGMSGGNGTDGGTGDGASLFDFGGHAHGGSSDFGGGESGGDSCGGDGGS